MCLGDDFDRKKFQTVSVVRPGEFLRLPDVGRLDQAAHWRLNGTRVGLEPWVAFVQRRWPPTLSYLIDGVACEDGLSPLPVFLRSCDYRVP